MVVFAIRIPCCFGIDLCGTLIAVMSSCGSRYTRFQLQLGDPDIRRSRDYRDGQPRHESICSDYRHALDHQDRVRSAIGGHFLDAHRTSRRLHWSGSPGRISRRCADVETTDFNIEVDCAILLSSILGTSLFVIGKSSHTECVLGEIAERFPGARQVALALVEIKGLGGCGLRFGKRPDAART